MTQIDRLYRRILMNVAPAKILATDDTGPIHTVQVNLNGGPEVVDQLAVMQHYGLNAHAPIGSDAAAMFIAGQRSNGVIVATNNQKARLRNLQPGEVALYTDEGDNLKFGRQQAVALSAGNSFQATTKAATIKGTDTVTLDSPVSSVTDKLVLAHDPEAPMEACTKQYADALATGGGGGQGPPGPAGPPGTAATIEVGTTVTGAAGTPANVVNVGTPSAAIFDLTIPQGIQGVAGATGATGSPGAAASIAVGTTTTGAPGTAAIVTNTGSSAAAVFNFTIPAGVAGAQGSPGTPGAAGVAATIAVGTTVTGAPGTAAAVVNVGSSSAAVFNFTIPRGDVGATGATGPAGPPGSTPAIGGSNLQIQYNNAGALGGAANWTFAAPNILLGNTTGSPPPPLLVTDAAIQLVGTTGAQVGLQANAFGASAVLHMQRADGTPAAPAAIAALNETLAAIFVRGYTGSAYSGVVARMSAVSTQAWTTAANGCGLSFCTTANGAAVNVQTMGLGMGGLGGLALPLTIADMGQGTVNVSAGYYINGANIFAGLTANALVIGAGANAAPTVSPGWSIPQSNVLRGNMNAAAPPSTPLPGIQVIGLDATSVGYLADTFGNTYSQILMRAAGGTGAAPAALASNVVLGLVGVRGWNGSAYTGSMAYEYFITTEAWSTAANGCKIYWVITPSTTVAPIVAMTLGAGVTSASGGLVVGNSAQDMGLGTVNAISGYYRAGAPLLGDWTFAPGQIVGNNATSNWIQWNTAGLNTPTMTTRSAGTKLVLYPSLSGTATDYALGISSGTMWFSTGGGTFAWYSNATLLMTLSPGGNLGLTAGSTLTIGSLLTSAASGGVFTISGTPSITGMLSTPGGITSTANIVCSQAINPAANNASSIGTASIAWNQMNCYNYFTASDRREKIDIAPLPSSLDLVEAIVPKTFRWAEGEDERTHWGFIAQEVGEAMTAAGHDFGGHQVDPEGGRERLGYNELVATLWQATRELAARVAHLEAAAA